jgi:hypothetical protein
MSATAATSEAGGEVKTQLGFLAWVCVYQIVHRHLYMPCGSEMRGDIQKKREENGIKRKEGERKVGEGGEREGGGRKEKGGRGRKRGGAEV